jgi:large subunit ribosomal protein L17
MLANMTVSLIRAKRINTTVAKAKALRVYAEPIINRAKEDTTNSRRIVFSYLQDKEAVKELFGDIAVKIANRPGGYLRILKLGQNRLGDNAEMAMIEFVDYNENLLKDNVEKKTKTRRSRSKKAAEAAPAAEPEAKAE